LQPLHPATKFTISSLNINTKSTITANHQQEKLSPILYLCIMRLKKEIKNFIEEKTSIMFPGVEIYLFGSRLDDNGRGGDIDLLLLSEQKIDTRKLRRFRLEFYKKFGWQKIDLINFTKEDNTTFKKLILTSAQAI